MGRPSPSNEWGSSGKGSLVENGKVKQGLN